jgi:MFS family permease
MNMKTMNRTGINLLLINAFIYISFSLYTPFLTSYYTKAGMNAVKVGVLLTLGPLMAIFVQPLWAVLSDKTGRRKDVLSLVVLGSAVSMFSYYAGKSFVSFFIASFLVAIFSFSIVPLSDAISLRSAHKNHFDFSKIRLGGTIGFAIVVIIAGEIIKIKPELQFFMGFCGYMVLFLFIRLLPKAEADGECPVPAYVRTTLKDRLNINKIFENKSIYFILAFAFIDQVGLSFIYTFLGVYMVKLGFSEGSIGLINCVSAFSEIPVLFLINRVLTKRSTMSITILGCTFAGIRIFTVTGESIVFFALSQAFHGLSFMTIYYSCAVYISKNVKPENQSKGQSILAIVQAGIGSIVGNIAGGFLVDAFGLKQSFRIMTSVVVSTTLVILFFYMLYRKRTRKNQ